MKAMVYTTYGSPDVLQLIPAMLNCGTQWSKRGFEYAWVW
jgi:hypothetical protein